MFLRKNGHAGEEVRPLHLLDANHGPESLEVEDAVRPVQHLLHLVDDELLVQASREGEPEHEAIETLLKGKEIELPHGHSFLDKDGHTRHAVRIRWFDPSVRTYQDAFMGPEQARSHIPEDPIGADHMIQYSHSDPPVFVGHYWLDDGPGPLAPNVACLDYSVASDSGGKLVAYRWDGGDVE